MDLIAMPWLFVLLKRRRFYSGALLHVRRPLRASTQSHYTNRAGDGTVLTTKEK